MKKILLTALIAGASLGAVASTAISCYEMREIENVGVTKIISDEHQTMRLLEKTVDYGSYLVPTAAAITALLALAYKRK